MLVSNGIAVLGDPEVGKTSIVNMLRGVAFSFHYKATLAFDSNEITIAEENGEEHRIQLTEFSGHSIYSGIRDSFEWDVTGAILVVDATKQETLYNLSAWITLARKQGVQDNNIIFCLNKIDMIDFIAVTFSDLHKAVLSEQLLPNLIISSPYTNVGHDKILRTILKIFE